MVDDLPLSARRYFHLERSNLLMFLSGLLQVNDTMDIKMPYN